jgi:antitoxin Phd
MTIVVTIEVSEMKEIQFREAKAQLSAVLDDAVSGKPAVITRHGKREGVLISYAEYERLSRVPSLGWLLTHSPLEEGDIPERSGKPARARKDLF